MINKERQPPFANAMLYANEMTRRVAYNTNICATKYARCSHNEKQGGEVNETGK